MTGTRKRGDDDGPTITSLSDRQVDQLRRLSATMGERLNHRPPACVTNPTIFQSAQSRGAISATARDMCNHCPALDPCRESAHVLGVLARGMWGGETARERNDSEQPPDQGNGK